MSDVTEAIVRPSSYPPEGDLMDEILDRFAPSLEGKTVLVKPNCLMAAAPDKGVTTHPSVVRTLVDALLSRGAMVRVGDNPGARGYGAGEECFRAAGLLAAAGACYRDIGRKTVRLAVRSRFTDHLVVSRLVLDADYVITVPKLKTHILTMMTGAVKNMYGILAGGEKVKLHYLARRGEEFQEALVDVYAVRPPDLAIVDAVTVMQGDGPSRGELREGGTLIASDNAVAADIVGARLMGTAAGRVRHLVIAAERGLGPAREEELSIDGSVSPLKGFRLPSTFRVGLANTFANKIVFNVLHRSRIYVEQRECAECGECREACPAGAMREENGRYRIDEQHCHQCFCCYELCPYGAVKVRGPLKTLMQGRSRAGKE